MVAYFATVWCLVLSLVPSNHQCCAMGSWFLLGPVPCGPVLSFAWPAISGVWQVCGVLFKWLSGPYHCGSFAAGVLSGCMFSGTLQLTFGASAIAVLSILGHLMLMWVLIPQCMWLRLIQYCVLGPWMPRAPVAPPPLLWCVCSALGSPLGLQTGVLSRTWVSVGSSFSCVACRPRCLCCSLSVLPPGRFWQC